MPGTYSKLKTVVTGGVILAADRNDEHDNHIANADPDGIGDASATTTEMQATADPYPAGSPSLATSERGELQRLRYLIKQITGETQWYIDPDTSILAEFNKGADIASANALALGSDGNYFDVTGTTAITSIGTRRVGSIVRLHFDAILTLTHHATDLILPGSANITTAAGDEAEFIEYASGDWRCIKYQKASGLSVIGGVTNGDSHNHVGGDGGALIQGCLVDYAAGDYKAGINPTARTSTSGSYVKLKEMVIGRGGTIRTVFDFQRTAGTSTVNARVYRNGIAVGTERTTSATPQVDVTEDIAGWSAGDLYQVYAHSDGSDTVEVSNQEIQVSAGTIMDNGMLEGA